LEGAVPVADQDEEVRGIAGLLEDSEIGDAVVVEIAGHGGDIPHDSGNAAAEGADGVQAAAAVADRESAAAQID